MKIILFYIKDLASQIAYIPPNKITISACDRRIKILSDLIEGNETIDCAYTDQVTTALAYIREKHHNIKRDSLLIMAKTKLEQARVIILNHFMINSIIYEGKMLLVIRIFKELLK